MEGPGTKVYSDEDLKEYLFFALKYEGINLLFFKKLFQKRYRKMKLSRIILSEYTSQYNRKLWFLYEWLMGKRLPIVDLKIKNLIPLIDTEIQYASPVSINSKELKTQLPSDPINQVGDCGDPRFNLKLAGMKRRNLSPLIQLVQVLPTTPVCIITVFPITEIVMIFVVPWIPD